MAYELIKVSELPELTTPSDPNVLPIQDGDYLKRISFENLKEAVTDDVADDLAAEVTAREGAVSDEATARGNADTAILADLASPYSASATYAVGDYCTKDGQLYRCTTAITTAEAWTAAHWSAVALGDDTRDLRSASNDIKNAFIMDSTLGVPYWEMGAINLAAGTITSDSPTTRVRTISYIPNYFDSISVNTGYKFALFAYNSSNDTYIGAWNGTEYVKSNPNSIWHDSVAVKGYTSSYNFKIVLRKADDSTITRADTSAVSIYSLVDITLTKSGKAADAKEVGDRLNGINNSFKSISEDGDIYINEINDVSQLVAGKAINGSGQIINESRSYCTVIPVDVISGANIKCSVKLSTYVNAYQFILFYDSNDTFISRIGGRFSDGYISIDINKEGIPQNAKYYRWTLSYVEVGNVSSCSLVSYYPLKIISAPKKKFYVFGDSISAGYYSMTESMAQAKGLTFDYTSPVTSPSGEVTGSVWDKTLEHNYWGYLNKWFLHQELTGLASPAQGYLHTGANSKMGINMVDDSSYADAGLIIVAWGFNDWHYNMTRGNHNLIDSNVPVPTDNYDKTQLTTINHAIWYCLGRLIQKAPTAKIVVLTPMNGWAYGGDFSTNWGIGYAMSYSGTLKDIHDDIVYWCDYYGLQYIDMTFNNSVVNRVNIKDTIIDGSHPSDEAHKLLARTVYPKIGW